MASNKKDIHTREPAERPTRDSVSLDLGQALLLHELEGRAVSIGILAREVALKLGPFEISWTSDRLLRIARTAEEMHSITIAMRSVNSGLPPRRLIIDVTEMANLISQRRQLQNPAYGNASVEVQRDIKVCGDPHEIWIVLDNLLTNALKYSAAHAAPKVNVRGVSIEGRPAVQISDNGRGVAPQNIERIFMPFARLDPDVEGMGIGLMIAKTIVERHGGRIWAEGELGLGLSVSFWV
jgi:signal transduction histidine kinase